MRSRKVRFTSLFVVLAAALAITGLVAPGASAAVGDLQISIVNQPADAGVGDLITAEAFDPTGGDIGYVQVHVTQTVCDPENLETCVPVDQDLQFADVTFELPGGSPSSDLHVISRATNADGNATFAPVCDPETLECDNPLWIGTANQPFTTEYHLIPVVTPPASETSTSGTQSTAFDIWGDGCKGNGCNVNLSPGIGSSDEYTTSENVGMGASDVSPGGTNIVCPGQQVVFSTDLFFHATTGTEPVFLVTHIDRRDMKKLTNNGQRFVGWCLGLEGPGHWNFPQKDTNGNNTLDSGDLFVGLAPKCPKTNPKAGAPCYVTKMSDGIGGSFIRGWLPGGDPPRRT